MNDWLTAAIAFAVGALVCRVVAGRALHDPPERLVRTNVDGHPVPAVLGWALVAGVLAGELVWVVDQYRDVQSLRCVGLELGPNEQCHPFGLSLVWRSGLAFAFLTLGMFGVGLWDDLKGDERPRGFQGHLASVRTGVITGGILKLVGGTVTGIVAAALLGFPGLLGILLAALCIALSANAINLFDRGPGRASKVFLVVAVPLLLWQPLPWLAAAVGAALAVLPYDLKARGMLGDAGANPMGAILGLALTTSTYYRPGIAFAVLLVVLLALNVASERVSFSEVIANNRVLARLDHLGRE